MTNVNETNETNEADAGRPLAELSWADLATRRRQAIESARVARDAGYLERAQAAEDLLQLIEQELDARRVTAAESTEKFSW